MMYVYVMYDVCKKYTGTLVQLYCSRKPEAQTIKSAWTLVLVEIHSRHHNPSVFTEDKRQETRAANKLPSCYCSKSAMQLASLRLEDERKTKGVSGKANE